MSAITTAPLLFRLRHRHRHHRRRVDCLTPVQECRQGVSQKLPPLGSSCHVRYSNARRNFAPAQALRSAETSTNESSEVIFRKMFHLERSEQIEGKITIRLERGTDDNCWQLIVGCTLPGKWILHWGVRYVEDASSEWGQPPMEMRPPGTIAIKDYAVETPLEEVPALVEGSTFYELKIDFKYSCSISAINFVLKDEETSRWYKHMGGDFKVLLAESLQDGGNGAGSRKSSSTWTGAFGKISNMLLNNEDNDFEGDGSQESKLKRWGIHGFFEEHSVFKELISSNSVTVSVRRSPERNGSVLDIETDLPGDVVIHWGVSKDGSNRWEIPSEACPPETTIFKNKAFQTLLQKKDDGHGSGVSIPVIDGLSAFMFVLKVNESEWLNCKGNDFYIPLSRSVTVGKHYAPSDPSNEGGFRSYTASDGLEVDNIDSAAADGIISNIRHLVNNISSERSLTTKSKAVQESILQEIEKLAAEAYSIFRTSMPKFTGISQLEDEDQLTPVKISSGTGSGFEILCQGFNWESHKSGRCYIELHDKALELSDIGFTVIWLPPPTASVSPEGYMPTDLYNLNSRYGNIDELKAVVKRLQEVGIKVLGDVVLNHRCAQYRNQNGIWNIFGGRMNWDDRAVVSDDPNFQGRGNRSSGDHFHAAPNIDHSQDFVRRDIKEWMKWLREEVGFDGWRFDFVRGFWGGYIKEYMAATEPYFAVGEFWDSLSYTYGQMDRNQDAHRQRIIDWINATNGSAGAFDVTTKGILHSVLEKCEYWRLSDEKGKPPGVMGWWPSRAVTFIENHDTGSTQGHWRFPAGKEMQGYCYILTHPGTPSVFYDHIFSGLRPEIESLISIRKRNKIHCRSIVEIVKAEKDVYAAIIDEKVAVKIGPGNHDATRDQQNWTVAMEGKDYKVWELS